MNVSKFASREFRLSVFLTILALSIGHFYTCEVYRNRLNLSQPLMPPKVTLESPSGLRPVRRLWILVLDGLRPDVATQMPELQSLAKIGVQGKLRAELPALTYPGLASMATGLPPLYSGVRINLPLPNDLVHDSVSKAAAKAGYNIRYYDQAFEPFSQLLFLPNSAEKIELENLSTKDPKHKELVWIYFGDIDDNGHQFGGASKQYTDAAMKADLLVGKLLKKLDLEKDSLVVVSEHGHRDKGGHGGPEEKSRMGTFVAGGGPFISRHDIFEAALPRVAATLTVALGVEFPKEAMGHPIHSAFGLKGRFGQFDEFPSNQERLLPFRQRAQLRLVLAAVLLILFAAVLIYFCRRGVLDLRLRDSIPSLIYVVTFFTVYFMAGYPLGWSMPRGGYTFVSEMGVFGFTAGGIACVSGRRDRRAQESVVAALFFLSPYALLMSYIGVDLRWLEGTDLSFYPILLGCMGFTSCLTLGLRLLLPTPKVKISGPDQSP